MGDPKQTRYIPPSERGGGKGKKSGDRTGGQQNRDGERNQPLNQPLDAGFQMERISRQIVTLKNCANGEAYQFMRKRWDAAMLNYNDPKVDLSVRPIMYYGGNVWSKLPHQIMATANKTMRPTMSPKDYVTEGRKGLLLPKSSSSSNN